MIEFEIMNKKTGDTMIVFGYSLYNALRESKIVNPNDWFCINQEYID